MLIELDLLAFTVFRLAYGTLLIAVLFVPFGIYNSMTEPYVSGALWGFMLPVGYVAAASGVACNSLSTVNPAEETGDRLSSDINWLLDVVFRIGIS